MICSILALKKTQLHFHGCFCPMKIKPNMFRFLLPRPLHCSALASISPSLFPLSHLTFSCLSAPRLRVLFVNVCWRRLLLRLTPLHFCVSSGGSHWFEVKYLYSSCKLRIPVTPKADIQAHKHTHLHCSVKQSQCPVFMPLCNPPLLYFVYWFCLCHQHFLLKKRRKNENLCLGSVTFVLMLRCCVLKHFT